MEFSRPGYWSGYPFPSPGDLPNPGIISRSPWIPLQMDSLPPEHKRSPPAMQETWVQSMGWEDPLEKGMDTQSSVLASEIPWKRRLAGYSPWGHEESDMTK